MRIMWHSNAPWAPTGYGNQTALVVPRLRDRLGHDVAISASWGLMGSTLEWEGIPVYPQGFHPYGMDIWGGHAKEWKADVMVSLLDAWVLEPQTLGGVPWMPWFPIDMEPPPPPVIEKVRQAAVPVTMSRHANRVVSEAGVANVYVPHCYDPAVLYRDDEARRAARDWMQVTDDQYVIGMVAANKGGYPSRKAIPVVVEAFARIAADHPQAILYVHTHLGTEMQGVDIVALCRQMGVLDRLRAPDQYRNHAGLITQDFMRSIYNALDVMANPSMGVGFGIPILEAQACGTPVITGSWTAMDELTWAGWKLDRDTESEGFQNPLGSWMRQPHVSAVEAAMRQAMAFGDVPSLRLEAANGAVPYQADHVVDTYWRPALDLLGQVTQQATQPSDTIVSRLSAVAS
jgi:glycosyltransferase involved in cell wall biosynthesis